MRCWHPAYVLVRPWSLAISAATALALAPATSAWSDAHEAVPGSTRSRTLVSHRQEGGVGGPKPSLIVSARGQATVRLGRCVVRFHLHAALWKSLKATLPSQVTIRPLRDPQTRSPT